MRSLKWQSTLAVFMTMCAGLVPAVQSVLDRDEISSDQILAVRGTEDLGVIVIYHRP